MDPARCRRCGQKHYGLCADVAALNRAFQTRKTVQVAPKPEEHTGNAKLDPSPEPLQGTATPRKGMDPRQGSGKAQRTPVGPIAAPRNEFKVDEPPPNASKEMTPEHFQALTEALDATNVSFAGKADTVSNARSANALRVARWQSAHPEKAAAKQRAYRQRKAAQKAKPQ